ncbi:MULTISPECIES: phosphotriesterase [Mesorhizobium]|uniref:phosphotriesterase family protein n=1 Tax=Mesorhizobium sp. TaxID=1871066 RepID=UPI000562FF75|nr:MULTISPECIES: phosphotriesterase [Mesorhizobium]RWL16123.1 MAG: phosphotriesterase [Mesorhizobium sp.]RWM75479.1 MAG: phosphotriesterase [Mesorhizobium sp.]TIO23306.1 MAG: phosphotriesterase [Mesorhizobium sp.]TJV61425.1 MAG: phosphotriesterase [Mesorhizobium sp.]
MSDLFDDAAPRQRLAIGVESGQVMTVLGPVPVEEMGVTLMHEHILLDGARTWKCPCHPDDMALAEQPVNIEIIGELRMNPYVNRDNVSLDDSDLALSELQRYRALGGHTVVDATNIGIGREAEKLARISRMSGLKIVMGTGFYLEHTHPEWLKTMDVDAVTEFIVNDVGGGERQPTILAGLIGEVGVSKDFTSEERKSLRASARASRITGVPLSIHLPGWERLAHEVLDVVEAEGADLRHTVLCHMNPSHNDLDYQTSLARRGAFLEYDMIGMDYYYADQDAQSPSDEENARAIAALIDAGFGDRLLLSQDVFLKIMLTRFGGFGYGYILKHFVPRLKRHGVEQPAIDRMLVANPRAVFSRRN